MYAVRDTGDPVLGSRLAKTPWFLVGNGGRDPYDSLFKVPYSSPKSPLLPLSVLRTREKTSARANHSMRSPFRLGRAVFGCTLYLQSPMWVVLQTRVPLMVLFFTSVPYYFRDLTQNPTSTLVPLFVFCFVGLRSLWV